VAVCRCPGRELVRKGSLASHAGLGAIWRAGLHLQPQPLEIRGLSDGAFRKLGRYPILRCAELEAERIQFPLHAHVQIFHPLRNVTLTFVDICRLLVAAAGLSTILLNVPLFHHTNS